MAKIPTDVLESKKFELLRSFFHSDFSPKILDARLKLIQQKVRWQLLIEGKEFEWIEEQAKKFLPELNKITNDNIDVICFLAHCYEKGIFFPQNFKKAFDLYTLLSEKGCLKSDINARCKFIKYCLLGVADIIPPDHKKGLEELTNLIKNEKEISNKAFNALFSNSSEFPPPLKVKMFEIFSEAQHPGAQFSLACCYIDGCGVEKNHLKGFQLLTTSANKGDISAQCELYQCYIEGIGVQQDIKRGLEGTKDFVLSKAPIDFVPSNEIIVDSLLQAAKYYLRKDAPQAIKVAGFEILQILIQLPNLIAQKSLDKTNVYPDEIIPDSLDLKTRADLLEPRYPGMVNMMVFGYMEEPYYITAKQLLCFCYIEGNGVQQDIKKGLEEFKSLINLIHNENFLFRYHRQNEKNLAVGRILNSLFEQVKQYSQSVPEALRGIVVEMLRMLAETWHPIVSKAIRMLYYCYFEGWGVAKDSNAALSIIYITHHWLFSSATFYERNGDRKEAYDIYYFLAQRQHPDAAYKVAFYNIHGLGVQKNPKYGFDLLHSLSKEGHPSAQEGHPSAQYELGYSYENGIYVAKDPEKALTLFKLATEKRDTEKLTPVQKLGVAKAYLKLRSYYIQRELVSQAIVSSSSSSSSSLNPHVSAVPVALNFRSDAQPITSSSYPLKPSGNHKKAVSCFLNGFKLYGQAADEGDAQAQNELKEILEIDVNIDLIEGMYSRFIQDFQRFSTTSSTKNIKINMPK